MEFQINIDELKLKCDNCQKRYLGSEVNGMLLTFTRKIILMERLGETLNLLLLPNSPL